MSFKLPFQIPHATRCTLLCYTPCHPLYATMLLYSSDFWDCDAADALNNNQFISRGNTSQTPINTWLHAIGRPITIFPISQKRRQPHLIREARSQPYVQHAAYPPHDDLKEKKIQRPKKRMLEPSLIQLSNYDSYIYIYIYIYQAQCASLLSSLIYSQLSFSSLNQRDQRSVSFFFFNFLAKFIL